MPLEDHVYELRVYEAGSISVVDFTVRTDTGTHRISGKPIVGRQEIDLLSGRFSSGPWRIVVEDGDGTFIGLWAVSGRMRALYRLCELRVSVDGSAFATIGIGRLTELQQEQEFGFWILTIQDERTLERETELFRESGRALGSGAAANYAGTVVFPQGIDGIYGDFTVASSVTVIHQQTVGNLVQFLVFPDTPWHRFTPTPAAIELIRSDVKAIPNFSTTTTVGNFETLRAKIQGTEREVFGIAQGRPVADIGLTAGLESPPGQGLYIWVVWSGFPGGDPEPFILVMNDHEPTEELALHIGGSGNGFAVGTYLGDAYDEIEDRHGSFRHSASALTEIFDDEWYPLVRYRITAKERSGTALPRQVYLPFLIAPLLNSDFQVAPTSMRLPADDPATFFTFDNTNSSLPKPSWRHGSRQQITHINFPFMHEAQPGIAEASRSIEREEPLHAKGYKLDLIKEIERPLEKTHDVLTSFIRRELDIPIDGLHFSNELLVDVGLAGKQHAEAWANIVSREYFNRFGDGAIVTELHGDLTTAGATTEVGRWVKVSIDSYPEPNTGALGGTRIMQIVARERHPERILYVLLDGGPDAQQLSTPSVSAAAGTGLYQVDVTISGLDAGAGYILQVRPSGGTWGPAGDGNGNETVTIEPLATGTTWEFRARAVAQGRISSNWSTTASQALATMVGPSALSSSSVTHRAADLDWTNGRTDVPVEVRLDESTCPGTRERVVLLDPGVIHYRLTGLNPNSTYCAGVRHVDPYGGISTENTHQFATSASGTQAPTPHGIVFLQGNACP